MTAVEQMLIALELKGKINALKHMVRNMNDEDFAKLINTAEEQGKFEVADVLRKIRSIEVE